MEEKEIIKLLLNLEKEQKRRFNNARLKRYNTGGKIHKKQLEFHQCLKRNRWVFGGNRSGKTECGAAETVYLARGNHPFKENKPTNGWVVSLTREMQRDIAQRKILDYIDPDWIVDIVMLSGRSDNPKGGVIDYITIKNVFGSLSTIGFKSCEMGRTKFQGTSLDYVWFDEEPPYEIYQECCMRVLDKKGLIYATMTPLLGLTFAYYDIYLNQKNDSEIWHIFMEWSDNPYLDREEIERAAKTLSSDELQSRRYGKFVHGTGLVYHEFDQNIHVIEPFEVPAYWHDNISIDPGLHNPLSCHWYAVDGDGNIFVIAEHYEAGKDIAYHCNAVKEQCRALKWHTDSKGRINALIDCAANQHTLTNAKSVSELFLEHGILVNPKVNKDVFSGINRVKQYLLNNGKPRLFIFKNCINLIREFKSYWWGKNDMPNKKDDHALDELRYYLMTKPEPSVLGQKEKSIIELDKEKLIKRLRYKSIKN